MSIERTILPPRSIAFPMRIALIEMLFMICLEELEKLSLDDSHEDTPDPVLKTEFESAPEDGGVLFGAEHPGGIGEHAGAGHEAMLHAQP